MHEAAILYNLKARHLQDLPYTRTGDICIACNPYVWMDHLYSDETRNKYAHHYVYSKQFENKDSLAPHVYETSSLSYRGLTFDSTNQSILVSGESGAGKTVSIISSVTKNDQQFSYIIKNCNCDRKQLRF